MRQSKPSDPKTYTKPELRDRIKKEVVDSDKGGKPGQWSARKAQLVAQEYEREGGGYKKPPNETQKSLTKWGSEEWTTSDGEKAQRPAGTTRYLPKKAWEELSPQERRSTNRKKLEGSQHGRQFVSNTEAAATARKKATKPVGKTGTATKKTVAKKSAAKRSSR